MELKDVSEREKRQERKRVEQILKLECVKLNVRESLSIVLPVKCS